MRKRTLFLFYGLLLGLLVGCERPDPEVTVVGNTLPIPIPPTAPVTRPAGETTDVLPPTPAVAPVLTSVPVIPRPTYVGTPTPDPTEPTLEEAPVNLSHTVSSGETLGYLAQVYGATVEDIAELNGIESTDYLFVGQVVIVPGRASQSGPNFKIVPDSELVYGPGARDFDISAFVNAYRGFLERYSYEVEGRLLSGPQIVELVAERFSVNPRLLLAYLEHRTGWITLTSPPVADEFMLGFREEGLYNQLSKAADAANWGFYARAEANVRAFALADGTRYAFAPEINDGTAGVQNMLGAHPRATGEQWRLDVGPDGLFATYLRLFGNPFAYAIEPPWPATLIQPALDLPWAPGIAWYFTGGPHGGWAAGSAWAALDFVPDSGLLGCYESDAWVTAMAPGLVVRSELGAVVVDMDGDGFAGTGWTVLYMHLATADRIPVGSYVERGDPLGHPSCEGGFSNGTHVHVARLYNGRWVSADGDVPFVMGGWVAQGLGREYDGLLVRDGVTKEACICREEMNRIERER